VQPSPLLFLPSALNQQLFHLMFNKLPTMNEQLVRGREDVYFSFIFDVEAVFFYPWAVLLRQLKWFGLIEMGVFIGILAIALAHIWRKGGLEWD